MKGHRWGPWEQRCTLLRLEITTLPVIRLRENFSRRQTARYVLCKSWDHHRCQRCVIDQSNSTELEVLTVWRHLETNPRDFPDIRGKPRRDDVLLCRGQCPLADFVQWMLTWFHKKAAKGRDPDIWFTWDFWISSQTETYWRPVINWCIFASVRSLRKYVAD